MGAFIAFELARHLRRSVDRARRCSRSPRACAADSRSRSADPSPAGRRAAAGDAGLGRSRASSCSTRSSSPCCCPRFAPISRCARPTPTSTSRRSTAPISVLRRRATTTKVPRALLSPWKVQTTPGVPAPHFSRQSLLLPAGRARAAVLQALATTAEPQLPRGRQRDPEIAPRADVERHDCRLWRDVLRRAEGRPGRQLLRSRRQFAAGIRRVATCRHAAARSVSVLDLFRYPTIRLLAAAIWAEARRRAAGPTRGGPGEGRARRAATCDQGESP